MKDRYSLVTNPGTYPLSYDTNHGFFDENLEFFEVFETTGSNNSLILNFLKELELTIL
jgi:hypothetical protein